MFGMSFGEILIILLVAFIFLGPKRLVALTHQIGKWMNQLKEEMKHIKETSLPEFDDTTMYKPDVEFDKSLDEIKINKSNSI